MKRPFRHRWYHDADLRELLLVGVVLVAALVVVLLGRWWVEGRGMVEGRGSRVEGRK